MPLLNLETISTASLLIGLVITAALIILVPDWRLAIFALVAQYVLAAVLLATMIPLLLAIVRVISGGLAMMMLYLTCRQKSEAYYRARRAAPGFEARDAVDFRYHHDVFIAGFTFRFLALGLVASGIIGMAGSMSFLSVPPDILFSGVWLMAAGILVAILSRDVLRLGLGILMFTSGLCILETATESSLLLYGLLNISDLLLALVIAHLGGLPIPDLGDKRRRGDTP